MKNYIQHIIELFGHNEYSLGTRRRVQQWLADENHAEEKKEALHALWQQAGEQKVPRGMQQSIQRMQRNIGMQPAGSDYIPTAEIREFTLPDGTRVMLNSKSTLLYPEQFTGKTRSVYLIGEANFQVKQDKEHPFIVKANDFQITALGTEFNVNAYPENDELTATLLEGSVKVEFNNLLSNVILKPNEQITYNKQTRKRSLQTPRMEDVTAWQRGELVFSNIHLDEIFTSLERKFPYTFVYSLHSLNDKTYSFRFQQKATLEEVMQIITQVAGDVKYVIRGNKCYITDNE